MSEISDGNVKSYHPGGLRLTDRAVRKSGIEVPARVLDIGCGDGATVAYLREHGYDALGVNENAECLPFPDASFDMALLECVLSLLTEPSLALSEARRVLRPGGVLIVSDVYERGVNTLERLIEFSGFEVFLKEDHTPALSAYALENDVQSCDFCGKTLKKPGYILYVCRAVSSLEVWNEEKTGGVSDYTERKLAEIISYAKTYSRFYRNLPDSNQISDLPFTTPADIISDCNAFLCVSPRETARCVTLPTSGTSGKPKRIFFNDEDLELTASFFDYGMRTIARPNGHAAIFIPGEAYGSVGERLTEALRRFDCGATVFGIIEDPAEALGLLNASKADCVVGIPAQILAISKFGNAPRVRSVLLSADYVPFSIVNTIESQWNCKVFTHYGMTETGLGGAVQCSVRNGMHIREPDLYCEIIDPISGEILPDGETGELVITTLTRQAMPLIRYRTGDITSILPGECSCGCKLKRISRNVSRAGGELSHALDEALFAIPSVLNFHAVITPDNTMSIVVELIKNTEDTGALDLIKTTAQKISGMRTVAGQGKIERHNGSIKRGLKLF